MPEIIKFPTSAGRSNVKVPRLYPAEPLNLQLAYPFNPAYDVNYRQGMNQEWNRSDNQWWGEQILQGLASRGLSIGTKVVAGVGSIATIPFANNIEDLWTNPLTNWANKADEELQNIFPVYKSRNYSDSGLLGKMLTTSFWTTDFLDGVAYAASAYVPGGLIGKGLTAANKALSAGDVGASLLSKLTKIGATQQRANLVLATGYNTVAEAAAEAYQTQKEIESILIEQGLSPEEAKQKAAESARETFGANLAVLAVPNFVQNQLFHGSWASKVKEVRDASIKSKGAATAAEFTGSLRNKVLTGIASEGFWEENVQTAIQQYERAAAEGLTDKDFVSEVQDNMYSNIKGLIKSFLPGPESPKEIEGAVSIVLGGILGAGFGALSHRNDRKQFETLVGEENQAYKDFFGKVVPAAESLFRENVSSIYRTKGKKQIQDGDTTIEINDYELDENGKPIIDQNKLHNLLYASLKDTHFWNVDMLTAFQNNEMIGNYNKEVALASYAYELATKANRYSKENILELLDTLEQKGSEEAKTLGIETFIKDNTAKIKQYLDLVEKTTNKHISAKTASDPDTYAFKQFLNKTEIYLNSKLNALKELRSTTTDMNKLEQINLVEADALNHLRMINEEESHIKDIFDNRVRAVSKMLSEVNTLNKKKARTAEENDKLRELTYRIEEEAYTYGTQAFQQSGARGNPIGLNSGQMVKVIPGLIDDYSYGIGTSFIALRRTQQELERNDLRKAVENFALIDAEVLPSELETTAQQLTTKLVAEKSNLEFGRDKAIAIQESVDFLLSEDNYDEEGNPRSLSDIADEETSNSVIKALEEIGITLTPDAPLTDDVLQDISHTFAAVQPQLIQDFASALDALRLLDMQLEVVNTYKDRINARDNKYQQLFKATNKEEFLKKQFYIDSVEAPVKKLIDILRKNKDRIDEGSFGEVTKWIQNLRVVKSAYTNREDPNIPKEYVLDSVEELSKILEEEILPIIIKVIEDKQLVQEETNNTQIKNLLSLLSIDKELSELFKTLLGENYAEIVKSAAKSYDGIEAVIADIRKKATKAQIETITSRLYMHRDSLAKDFYESLNPDTLSSSEKQFYNINLFSKYKWYLTMPHQMLPFLIQNMLEKELQDPNVEAHEILHKYVRDLDSFAFEISLDNYKALSNEKRDVIHKLLRIHFQVVSINKFIYNVTESNLDVAKLVELKSKLTVAPSLQQNVVITDLLNFLSSDLASSKDFGNVMIINGIAGSGKTHMIGKIGLSLWAALANKSVNDNVYALSRTARTSQNINESVYGSNLNKTYDNFLTLTDDQLDKVDVLLVDEVYTFSNQDWNTISIKLAEYNERRTQANKPTRIIKIVALGDPSQKTSGEVLNIRTNLAAAVKTSIPLTVTYRTNVDSISMFSRAYRMRAIEVAGTTAFANVSKEQAITDPSSAFGVIEGTQEEVLEALRAPSPRSRVLITSNEAQANYFRSQVNAEVLTVDQAHGYQWDEVYALLDPHLLGDDNFSINQSLYTAFSRAKAFLMVNGVDVTNTLPDASLNDSLTQSDKTLAQNKAAFTSVTSSALDTIQLLSGAPVVTSSDFIPTEFSTVDAPDTDSDVASPVSFAENPELPVEIIIQPAQPEFGEAHELRFPTNRHLRPIRLVDSSNNERLVSPVILNSKGYIIRTTRGKGQELHYVIAPYSQDTSKFVVIGALGDADYASNTQLSRLSANTTGSIPVTFVNEAAPFSLTEEQLRTATVSEFTLESYQHLKTLQLPDYLENDDPIEKAIIDFYNSYFGITPDGERLYPAEVYNELGIPTHFDKDWVVNNRVNWKAIKGKVEFRIMTKKELEKIPKDFNVIVGAPYLVIIGALQKGSSKDTKAARRFYIPFQPKPFHQDSQIYQRIRQLRDDIEILENVLSSNGYNIKLGSQEMEDLVHWFAKTNFHMKVDTTSVFSETGHVTRLVEPNASIQSIETFFGVNKPELTIANKVLTAIIKATYGIDERLKVFNTEKEANKFLEDNAVLTDGKWTLTSEDVSTNTGENKTHTILGVKALSNGKFVLIEATDPTDETATQNYKEYTVTSGKGQAQRDINNLAMANKAIGEIPFRITQLYTVGGRSEYLTRAKSIFSSTDALDLDGLLKDDRIIESGWNLSRKKSTEDNKITTELLDYLETVLDPDPTEARKKGVEILRQYTIKPFTLERLDLLVGDALFNDNGYHLLLRTPLRLHTASYTGVNDIGTNDSKKNSFSLHDETVRKELGSKVMTRFAGIQKTSVTINLLGAPVPPKPPIIPTNVGELLDILPSTTNVPYLNELITLLKQIPSQHQAEVFFGEKFVIDGIETRDESFTIYNAKYKGGVGIYLTVPLYAIQSGAATELVLHEILHAFTGKQLIQGQEDLKNNVDSKEALFAKRIVALQKRFNAVLARRGIKQAEIYRKTRGKFTPLEFIANLTDRRFHEAASSIEAVSKRGKSILREIIEAILDLFTSFFSDLSKRNIYETTLKAFEDYYASAIVSTPTTKTEPEIANTVETLKASVEGLIKSIPNIESIKPLVRGVLNTSKLPEIIYTPLFEKSSEARKLEILSKLRNELTNKLSDISFAYNTTPTEYMQSYIGSVTSTGNLRSFIENTFPKELLDSLTIEQFNLLYSVIHKQITNPELSLVHNLIYFQEQESIPQLVDELFRLLTRAEKESLREEFELVTYPELIHTLINGANVIPIVRDFVQVTNLLSNHVDLVEEIVGSIESRTPLIYKAAKEYILDIVRRNNELENSPTEIIRSKLALRDLIETKVTTANVTDLQDEIYRLHKTADTLRGLPPTESIISRYNELVTNTIPNLENQVLGIRALNQVNARTGNRLVYDVYKQLFPTSPYLEADTKEILAELQEYADMIYTSYDRLDEELVETANISEYIKEYNKSYELTLSESVKDFLASVRIADKHLSTGLAYIKLLQLSANLEFSNTANRTAIENVIYQLDEMLGTPEQQAQYSEVDLAVLQSLRNLLQKANTHPVDIPANVTIVTSTNPSGRIFYTGLVGRAPIQNVTYEESVEDTTIHRTNQREISSELYTELKQLYPDLTILQFNRLFARAEAINALRGIFNTMVSLKETDLYIASRSISKGLKYRFMRSKSSDITFGMKEEIRQNLIDKHEKDKLVDVVQKFPNIKHNGKTLEQIGKTGTTEEKLAYIRKFYNNVLGMGKLRLSLNSSTKHHETIVNYVEQIKEFLKVAKNLKHASEDTPTIALGEVNTEVPLDNSFTSFINNIDGYLTRFAELASKSSDFIRNPSVRTLKGDRYYKWHESNWGHDTLYALVDAHRDTTLIHATTGTNKYRQIPNHLYSSLYDNNIFIRGEVQNRILKLGEYEGALNEDVNAATPYKRENYFFFFHRKFASGFLAGLRQSNAKSYFQFTYIPSDKPKHPLAEIEVLSNEQADKAIELALRQILKKTTWRLNIKNYNKSVTDDLFRNFLIGKEALEFLQKKRPNYEFTEENIPEIAATAIEILEQRAKELAKGLTEDDVQMKFDIETNNIIINLREKGLLNSKFKLQLSEVKTKPFKTGRGEDYASSKGNIAYQILPLVELFVKNNYVNGYFLNQLIAGDYSAYSSSNDLLKRYAGVFAPGIRGLVDSSLGMDPEFKMLVLDDTHIEYEDLEAKLRSVLQPTPNEETEFQRVLSFFDQAGFDVTDAQGFMLPSRARQLSRGFERAWHKGAVHKPVHFEIQNRIVGENTSTAVPIYVKYSSVELSDDFLNSLDSPLMTRFRTNLEKLGVDEAVFGSAVKEGRPLMLDEDNNPEKLDFKTFIDLDDAGIERVKNLENSPILTLSNRHFRLQHNAAADPNKRVAIYTQLMYFLNAFTNVVERTANVPQSLKEQADRVYSLVAELIKIGREEFIQKINTQEKLYNFLRKELDGPGAERVIELLNSGVSINNPLIEKKAIIAIASGLESSTVRIQFSGGGLVLITAEGSRMMDETLEIPDTELSYRIETVNGRRTLLVDAIVPAEMLTTEQLQAVKNKQPLFVTGDALAFRIPSTELHSAVALRIVDVFKGRKKNIIIVPKEIVPIHGSDFDVDKLFVIMREKFDEAETSLLTASTIATYQEELRFILDSLNELEEGLTDEQREQINEYRNLIKERANVYKELNEEVDTTDQETVENDFQEYISTPQWSPRASTEIVRIDIDDFDELRARHEYAKASGHKWLSKENRWIEKSPLVRTLQDLNRFIREIQSGETGLSPELQNNLKALLSLKRQFRTDFKTALTQFGTKDSPVGYVRKSSYRTYVDPETGDILEEAAAYAFDPEFINKIKDELQQLKDLKGLLHEDLRNTFLPAINASIKHFEKLIQKAIKNEITETMLSVLSDTNNKYRMTTPIAFTAIQNAISEIPEHLRPTTTYDLSDVEDEYKAYSALASSEVLVGAFANAVKVFSYITQAGESTSGFKLYEAAKDLESRLSKLNAAIKIYTDFEVVDETEDEDLKAKATENEAALTKALELRKQARETLKIIQEQLGKERNKNLGSARSQINPNYYFSISKDGNTQHFNSLETVAKFTPIYVTEIFDTLINSAIDNLKLGYLSQAHINTRTGSFVIGATFLGVPLDITTKILYQPIFKPLLDGKSDRVDQFIRNIRKEHAEALEQLESEVLSVEELESVLRGVPANDNVPAIDVQLKAFLIFERGYKIGEDVRDLASFLNVIRRMEVFMETIDNVDNKLTNKIGTVEITDEGAVLHPHKDFSFVIPNLFRNTPHIEEAYLTHRALVDIISDNFKLHSPTLKKFSRKIAHGMSLRTDDFTNTSAANQADIRKAYAHYLLAQYTWKEVSETKQKIVRFTTKDNNEVKYMLSLPRSYASRVANKLNMVKEFAEKHEIRNRFLDTVFVSTNSSDAATISFRGGINLNPEDNQEITIDFRKLNKFLIGEHGVTMDPQAPPFSASEIQKELLNYAILIYGLQYSGTSFAQFINPQLIKVVDNWLNDLLDNHQENESRILEHFRLSYAIQNASRLNFVSWEDIKSPSEKQKAGKDIIVTTKDDGSTSEQTVYYDLRVTNKGSVKYGEFVKEGLGSSAKVYVRVGRSSEYTYYQRIGKVSDILYSPLSVDIDTYKVSDYFSPETFTLQYHFIDENKKTINSYQRLDNIIEQDTPLYIVPSHSFDRTDRKLVRLKLSSSYQTGAVPGYIYKYEEVTEVTLQDVGRMIKNNEIKQICEK